MPTSATSSAARDALAVFTATDNDFNPSPTPNPKGPVNGAVHMATSPAPPRPCKPASMYLPSLIFSVIPGSRSPDLNSPSVASSSGNPRDLPQTSLMPSIGEKLAANQASLAGVSQVCPGEPCCICSAALAIGEEYCTLFGSSWEIPLSSAIRLALSHLKVCLFFYGSRYAVRRCHLSIGRSRALRGRFHT